MKLRAYNIVDGYKFDHRRQYVPGTELVYSNFTCRSTSLAALLPDWDGKTVFFGMQGLCKWLLIDLWNETFFQKPKEEVCAYYARRIRNYLGRNAAEKIGVAHMEALHDLGYLPIEIKALPEGSRVNVKVPPFTIKSSNPDFFWLTNYLEDQLSNGIWKSIRNSTVAYEYRRLLDRYSELTGSPIAAVPIEGHDFALRGLGSPYDVASQAGHLLSFVGTDTVASIDFLEDYYNADSDKECVGISVPATEHSVACAGILSADPKSDAYAEARNVLAAYSKTPDDPKLIGEYLLIKRLITEVYPDGIVSLVSDTFDFFRTITEIVPALKDVIMNRAPDALGFAKVVFRPDSGDPVKVIAGNPDAPVGSPEYRGAVECLWDIFGGTTTSTGHKLLDSHVGLIYGDSITLSRCQAILEGQHRKGFASANCVFGIGSFTYQFATRDSHGCAMKATFARINGVDQVLYKDPATDQGKLKKSACGLLRVEKEGDDFVLYDMQTWEQEGQGALRTVFLNGQLIVEDDLKSIRARLGTFPAN